MRSIARDGRPYDIDFLGVLHPQEIEVIEYLKPNGVRRRSAIAVGESYAQRAKDLIFSAEVERNGVIIYARRIDQPEDEEIIRVVEKDRDKVAAAFKEIIDSLQEGGRNDG